MRGRREGPGKQPAGTVLVVEDNSINMKLARTLLELVPCEVLEAGCAEEALETLRSMHVDLVLLDVQLPGMDGLSACRAIRREAGGGSIPIVGLSALAMEEDVESALDAGFDDYITKPLDTRDFLKKIGGMLTERPG